MGTTVKVAAAQMAPVFMDREATVDKICELILEAGEEGAKLIAFPETIIPGYPYWVHLLDPASAGKFNRELFKQSVEVPSPVTDTLCAAAKAADCYAVVGLNERDGGTLYNSQLFIGPAGQIVGKRRKLVPFYHEQVIWGRGDNADLHVFSTPFATLGGLICAEHSNALFRYALQAQGEQIHLASWPGGIKQLMPVMDIFIRHYTYEAQAFVVNATSIVTQEVIEYLGTSGKLGQLESGLGFSAIVGPGGVYLAGPEHDKEVVLYADLNLDHLIDSKLLVDSVGHDSRPDVVRLLLRQTDSHQRPIVIEKLDAPPDSMVEAVVRNEEDGESRGTAGKG
jgi:aliphatic nitrilase